jgi:hypothetical protein
MKNKNDKTVTATFSCLTSHFNKLKEMSEKTLIPMSALVRVALEEFFKKHKNDSEKYEEFK